MYKTILAGAATLAIIHAPLAQAAEKSDAAWAAETAAAQEAKAAEAADFRKNGSWYLRCDGNPNNMTGGESFARLVGAVTLLGLFAPTPETTDPAKRLFAEKGVDACNRLIDDADKGEHNVVRRLPLILARTAHRIEAKDFAGAIADVDKARGEAKAAGLVGNPYFDRSMGLSFDLLESEARLRQGDPEGATAVRLRSALKMPWSWYAQIAAEPRMVPGMALSDDELRYYDQAARLDTISLLRGAFRLEEAGRFAEAAQRREMMIADAESMKPETRSSVFYAEAALSHALAGQWDQAAARAGIARTNLEDLRSAGKAEADAASVVEVLDLYGVALAVHEGRIAEARRIFGARSEWTSPARGAVEGVAALLMPGIKPEEKLGLLAQTRMQRENRARERLMATLAERDKDNKRLFALILPYAPINAFEAQSKQVWTLAKSKMQVKLKEPSKSGMDVYVNTGAAMTQPDALLLHTALLARAQGKAMNFYINARSPQMAVARFGTKGDGRVTDALLIDPEPVIAELSQVIPSPEALAQRQKAAR